MAATETTLVDYSFARPDPEKIKAAGCVGVMRYLAPLPNPKVITSAEVRHLHAHDLGIGLVWESTGNRAAEGHAAGVADRQAAEQQAKALGYPTACTIYYAVDFDATPAQVAEYFHGMAAAAGSYRHAPYGGIRIIEGLRSGWQTVAWSSGKLSAHAELYQRAGGPLSGTDINVVCRRVKLWGRKGVIEVAPPGTSVRTPQADPTPSSGVEESFVPQTRTAIEDLLKAAPLVERNVATRVEAKRTLPADDRKLAQKTVRELRATIATLESAIDL